MQNKNIYIASDHAGFDLKSKLLKNFPKINDLGTKTDESVDYPDFAHKSTKEVLKNKKNVGILICGTGVGMSIAANRKNEFDQCLYPKFGSLGVLGQTVKTHGGSGTSNLAYGLVAYEFEKIDSSYRSSISVQSSLVIHPINEFGSQEQKDKYLPPLIKGEKIGCFGLTESEAGSDPTSMKTSFKKTKD